ncbi:MAG: Myo-inositol 2-dehydrogenase [Verrucomicrobiae bacterium]|nr:Myo-inositol 2-dehydrogenase [Verrucomicrobiae bacterium]
MAGSWLKAAQTVGGIEFAGFVDIREEAARKRAAESGAPAPVIGTDLASVLTAAKPDVVFDCTIPEAHHRVTLTALEHGCHVLGEKPLADSMAHAREMVAAAKQAGKIYAVIQNRRYSPTIRRLRHFLDTGALGDMTTVNCDFYIGAHFGGFRDKMRHVLLLDMAIHTFDAARYITGANAVAVYCKEWNPRGSWYDMDASAIAIFEMSNGLIYTYRGSWCAEGLNTTWECDWRIVGSKGTAKWNGDAGFQAEVVTKTGGFFSEKAAVDWPAHDPGAKVDGHTGLMREFVECIRTGQTPETIGSDNIHSLAMVFAAIESAEKGQRVEVKV